MGVVILAIVVIGMFIIGFLISKQTKEESTKIEDNKSSVKKTDDKVDNTDNTDIQRLKVKYGLVPSLEFSELSNEEKESMINNMINQISHKITSLHTNGVLDNSDLANAIRNHQTWKHKKYLFSPHNEEYEEQESNVFYLIYFSLLKNSLVTSINKDYTYALDNEIFSFLILNDFVMTGEFKNPSNVVRRLNIKNFQFSTKGFEEIYQDLKPYLDRIDTNSSYNSTVRISSHLNRYIKLSDGESSRIKSELGYKFEKKRVPEYCNEIHFVEILGYDFLINYIKKYLDILQKLEDNVETKRGYSQYLSKYNLTIQ